MDFIINETDLEDLTTDELVQMANYYNIKIPSLDSNKKLVSYLRARGITPEKIDAVILEQRKIDPEILQGANEIEYNLQTGGYLDQATLYYEDNPEIMKILNYNCKADVPFAAMYEIIARVDIPLIVYLFGNKACIEAPYEVYFINKVVEDKNEMERERIGRESREILMRCTDHRFIIVPVIITFRSEDSHAASLFFDTLNKRVEYFDPAAGSAKWHLLVEDFFQTKIKDQYPEYTFIPMPNMCIQGGPFCAAYNILYLYLRSNRPNSESKDIISEIYKGQLGIEYLTYQLVCYLYDLVKIYSLQRIQDRYNKIKHKFELTPEEEELVDQYYLSLDLQSLRNLYYEFLRVTE